MINKFPTTFLLALLSLLPACSKKHVEAIEAGEEKTVQIAPGVTMKFCWCPAGEFMMGSPASEAGRKEKSEDYVHTVITKGFWMSKTEVTQAQWVAVMGSNPSKFKGGNNPVDSVSWNDIQDFLINLNMKVGNADGGQMILPTEAQWEYACRAGEIGPYSGGSIGEIAWYSDNSEEMTHSVGTKKPNAWGLCDMQGNVEEWCSDAYEGPTYGDSEVKSRVTRGGTWGSGELDCRAAIGYAYRPTHQLSLIGFRIAHSSAP
jgi:formylglycine-generating enzyme required for sulfatase activity